MARGNDGRICVRAVTVDDRQDSAKGVGADLVIVLVDEGKGAQTEVREEISGFGSTVFVSSGASTSTSRIRRSPSASSASPSMTRVTTRSKQRPTDLGQSGRSGGRGGVGAGRVSAITLAAVTNTTAVTRTITHALLPRILSPRYPTDAMLYAGRFRRSHRRRRVMLPPPSA